jgi:hypothetical protein
MFEDPERFVTAHRPCGQLTSDVGELKDTVPTAPAGIQRGEVGGGRQGQGRAR